MGKKYHILLIEDDREDVILFRETLSALNIRYALETAASLSEGIEKINQQDFDVVFLDLVLPDSAGFETFEKLHAIKQHVPIILLTGTDDDSLAQHAVREGAQDFLVKGQFDADRLSQSVFFSIERNQIINMILSSEIRFRAMIDQNTDGILIVDKDNKLRFANRSAEQMLGKNSKDLIGSEFEFPIHLSKPMEIEIPQKGNRKVFVELRTSRIKWGEDKAFLINMYDISQRKQYEDKLKALVNEKEVLLKEVHHRVTNNFHLITSMLNLHAQTISDEKTKDILKESSNRLNSMAIIHRQLYNSENLANINVGHYIRTLVVNLFKSYFSNSTAVVFEPDIDEVFLGVDKAIPCGLIVNELITNALKYAFPPGFKGRKRMAVRLREEKGEIISLMVSDTGIGLPEDFNLKKTQSLGLRLIRMLVEDQLDGSIRIDRSQGTRFSITFPGNSRT